MACFPDSSDEFIRQFRTPATATWIAGFVVGIPAGILDIGDAGGLVEYRHAVCVRLVSIGVIILGAIASRSGIADFVHPEV